MPDDEGTPPEDWNIGCLVSGVLLAGAWVAFLVGLVLFVYWAS